MREVDPVAVELEHASTPRKLDVVDGRGRKRLQQRHRGSRERGNGDERLAHPRRQRARGGRQRALQALGKRDRPRRPRRSCRRSARVPARARRTDSRPRPRARAREPAAAGSATVARREADGSPRPRAVRAGAARTPRRRGRARAAPATGRPRTVARTPTGSAVQPPQHEAEHLRRARVDPLHVVERDEQRPLLSERAHGRDQRHTEHARFGRRPLGLRAAATRSRARAAEPVAADGRVSSSVGREQIADRRERHLRLCRGRARRQERGSRAPVRRGHPRCKECGLADSGVAFDQQRLSSGRHGFEKPSQRLQLRPPADDRFCHRSAHPIVNQARCNGLQVAFLELS